MKAIEEQLARILAELKPTLEQNLELTELGPPKWKLPLPRICVMEPKRSRYVLGWHSPKRWHQGAVSIDEIVLTPISVGQGVFFAANVLLHELVHLANALAGRDDTSRQGRYHNQRFKETAEAMGLIVECDDVHGWAKTQLGPELREAVRELIGSGRVDIHPFKYQRSPGRRSGAALVKVTASCGTFAYVTAAKADHPSLRCSCCGECLARPEENPDCNQG